MVAEKIRLLFECSFDCKEKYKPICGMSGSSVFYTFPNDCEMQKRQCECLQCGMYREQMLIVNEIFFSFIYTGLKLIKILFHAEWKFFSNGSCEDVKPRKTVLSFSKK